MIKEKFSDLSRRKKLFTAAGLLVLSPVILNVFLAVTPLQIPVPQQLECEQRPPDVVYVYWLEDGEIVPEIKGIKNLVGFEGAEEMDLKPCNTDSITAYADSYVRTQLGLPRNVSSE